MLETAPVFAIQIGVDHEHDRARGLSVSEGGIVTVGKGETVPRD